MNHLSVHKPHKGYCLLVEDQLTTCDYLVTILQSAFPGIKTIVAGNIKEAHDWLEKYNRLPREPSLNLALVDLGLPDGCGIEIVRRIARDYPCVPTLVITIYDDDSHLFRALSAGAFGYLLKDEEPNCLVNLLKRVHQGEPPLSPSIAHRLIAHFRTPQLSPILGNEVTLTPREQETLTLIAKGFTVAETAAKMRLSALTVAGYVKVIYQKLHISNRAEATREAMRRGLA